jgi:hypothetical protein
MASHVFNAITPLYAPKLSCFGNTAGHSNHPIIALWSYFDLHGWSCYSNMIVAITGSTFTNHAPDQPDVSSQQRPAESAIARSSVAAQLQSSSASKRTLRYANSGSLDSPYLHLQQQAVTPWHVCTVLATFRDIRAGEEVLENYLDYDPPCVLRGDCPEFLAQGLDALDDPESSTEQGFGHAVLVQSLDTYVGSSSSSSRSSSSSSGPGGGLGVFAARDLPAGTVWNKEDAAHALTVTR